MANRLITGILGSAAAAALAGCALDTVGAEDCLHCSTTTQGTPISASDAGVGVGDAQAVVSAGEAAACTAWRTVSDRQTRTASWTAGAGPCDPGALPEATRQASLEWVNYYRGLVGLVAVTEDRSDRAPAQACAVLLERNGRLTHTPPASWACANLMGRDAAGRSNLSGNPGFPMSPWHAVRGWVDEARDLSNTLGHRRWLFSPELRTVSYGQTGSFACMTLGLGARDPRAPGWVAWPPAGWVPTAVVGSIWSFSMAGVNAGTRVEVLRDGAAVAVTAAARAGRVGEDTVSWEMPAVSAGSVYRVRVTVPGRSTIEYEVRPTGCARR